MQPYGLAAVAGATCCSGSQRRVGVAAVGVVALWGCGLLVAVRLILFGWHYAGQLNVRALAVSIVVTVVGACKSHCMADRAGKVIGAIALDAACQSGDTLS